MVDCWIVGDYEIVVYILGLVVDVFELMGVFFGVVECCIVWVGKDVENDVVIFDWC